MLISDSSAGARRAPTGRSRRILRAAGLLVAAAAVFWFGLGMHRGVLLSEDIKSRIWPWAPAFPAKEIVAPALSGPGLAVRSLDRDRTPRARIGPPSALEPVSERRGPARGQQSVGSGLAAVVAGARASAWPAGGTCRCCSGSSSRSSAPFSGFAISAARRAEPFSVDGIRTLGPVRRLAGTSGNADTRAAPVAPALHAARRQESVARRFPGSRPDHLCRHRRRTARVGSPGRVARRRGDVAGVARRPGRGAGLRRRAPRCRTRRTFRVPLHRIPAPERRMVRRGPAPFRSGASRPAAVRAPERPGIQRHRGGCGDLAGGPRARPRRALLAAAASGTPVLGGRRGGDAPRDVRQPGLASARVSHAGLLDARTPAASTGAGRARLGGGG